MGSFPRVEVQITGSGTMISHLLRRVKYFMVEIVSGFLPARRSHRLSSDCNINVKVPLHFCRNIEILCGIMGTSSIFSRAEFTSETASFRPKALRRNEAYAE